MEVCKDLLGMPGINLPPGRMEERVGIVGVPGTSSSSIKEVLQLSISSDLVPGLGVVETCIRRRRSCLDSSPRGVHEK